MRSIQARDFRVPTDQGQLFAKSWSVSAASTSTAPIVLFHDSLGCVELWRNFPEQLALATGRTVIAYDRLGFGQSDPHPGKLTNRFVHDEAHGGFRALRDHLGIGKFIAFGHSVGGGMAIAGAAAWAGDCDALITESAQTFVEDLTIQGIVEARLAFQQPDQLDRLKRYHGDKAAWVLSAWIDTWLAPDFTDWNLDQDLPQIRCPVLAIHGDGDEYGSAVHPQRIARLAGGPATASILAGCGHVPHREKEETVVEMVSTWLDRVMAEP